ncbi:MAG: hypothetical protein ISR47_01520 [Rhodospirillales bacterium]|nr:hypothetical protein [Rhodospirillales bacterium]
MSDSVGIQEVGVFVSSDSASYGNVHDSYWGMMGSAVCDALSARNEKCVFISPGIPAQLQGLLNSMSAGVFPRFFLFFNFLPRISFSQDAQSVQSIFDDIPARIVRMFLDHPAHVAGEVRNQVAVIDKNPALKPLRFFSVMEAAHIPALESLGVSREQIFVMPQGGPAVQGNTMPLKDRTIPVLFSGSISALAPDDEFARQNGCGDPHLRKRLEDSVEEVLDGDRDVFEIVTSRFAEPIADGTVGDPFPFILNVDRRTRTLRRYRLFATLRDIPVHFFGDIADDFMNANKNGRYLGNRSWREIQNLMADSRIVVNDTINLRDSALIRFFYPLALGAVAATESEQLSGALLCRWRGDHCVKTSRR